MCLTWILNVGTTHFGRFPPLYSDAVPFLTTVPFHPALFNPDPKATQQLSLGSQAPRCHIATTFVLGGVDVQLTLQAYTVIDA